MMVKIEKFEHIQSAHCENGVAANLLKFNGLEIADEPLVFGLGYGLFYIHIPFMQINHGPAVSFRSIPGYIFKRAANSLGISIVRKKFSNPASARQFLDDRLNEGIPVGCQVGVFHLPYFPREYRFHFNAHNIVVYGYENGKYLISDPVMETCTTLSPEALDDVRFARGPLAPNGHLYYPKRVPELDDKTLQKAIIKSIRSNAWWMIKPPLPFIGATGFKFTAKRIRKWPNQIGLKKSGLNLGQIIRMQEEIGTGGGGFRFIYAAFLEKAAKLLEREELMDYADIFTQTGDLLRASAVKMAAVFKGKEQEISYFNEVAEGLEHIGAIELKAFKEMYKIKD